MLLLALAAAIGCGGAAPAAHDRVSPVASPAFRLAADAVARPVSERRLAQEEWFGGQLKPSTGGAVTVYVSRAYADDPGAAQRWANYLGGLVHGAELNVLEAYIATPAEVRELCRAEALGCYGNDTMISIGEAVEGATAEAVVTHEYGHHVAHNRANPPWRAIDYGAKRWATYARICPRAAAGQIFPGDQGLRYQLNPGEGFAEAYRALVESRNGTGAFGWSLVDRSFYPDPEALARVEDDVLRPWVQPRRSITAGRIRVGTRSSTTTVATPLDGELNVSLKLAAGAGAKLQLLESEGARVAARGLWASATEQRASLRVCGSRTIRVRVTGVAGTRFTLGVSSP